MGRLARWGLAILLCWLGCAGPAAGDEHAGAGATFRIEGVLSFNGTSEPHVVASAFLPHSVAGALPGSFTVSDICFGSFNIIMIL